MQRSDVEAALYEVLGIYVQVFVGGDHAADNAGLQEDKADDTYSFHHFTQVLFSYKLFFAITG